MDDRQQLIASLKEKGLEAYWHAEYHKDRDHPSLTLTIKGPGGVVAIERGSNAEAVARLARTSVASLPT